MDGLVSKVREGTDLTYGEAGAATRCMLSGDSTDGQNAAFLGALAEKGETDEELLGMLDRMREFSVRVDTKAHGTVIDMCGTGGDMLRTFNVSTAASFIVAAAGGTVAKHGNRSSSGACGSADIFEYLGYDLDLGPLQAAEVLDRHGICFMFAQRFHPAMGRVAPARRMLGKRTAFNLLGPMSNPAGVESQLVGVSSEDMLYRLPRLLYRRGGRAQEEAGGGGGSTQNIMAVRSDDGMDELSTSSANRVAVLDGGGDGKVTVGRVDPEEVGLHRSSLGEIRVETRLQAIESFVGVLEGTARRAMVETAALNAAGGLVVSGIADGFPDGVETALRTVRDGAAFRTLEAFVSDTGDISKLREIADG